MKFLEKLFENKNEKKNGFERMNRIFNDLVDSRMASHLEDIKVKKGETIYVPIYITPGGSTLLKGYFTTVCEENVGYVILKIEDLTWTNSKTTAISMKDKLSSEYGLPEKGGYIVVTKDSKDDKFKWYPFDFLSGVSREKRAF